MLGAVKTNIGHLEAAAGMAGVIKVLLAMRHELIPANLHFTALNPNIDAAIDPFEIPTASRPWPRNTRPRIAGVSSFGFGGTNAHVVLEEPPASTVSETTRRSQRTSTAADERNDRHTETSILVISAQSDKALQALASRYSERLRADPDAVTDICYSAALHRDHLDCRAAVIGDNAGALETGLDAIARGDDALKVVRGRRAPNDRRIALVFSGQGSQWWGMGRQLRQTEPVFADALAACDAALKPYMRDSLLTELDRSEAASYLHETEIAQPSLFAIQVALAALWKSWGINAEAVVGHSVGEIAAAHVAGALSLPDAARLVARRGQTMQEATGLGRMASVELEEKEASEIARDSKGLLSLAAINGPRSCVLSGDAEALASTLQQLTQREISHELLPVNYAFHSQQMSPFEARLKRLIEGLMSSDALVPIFSTVTGLAIEGARLDPDYWGRNLRQPVRFAAAINSVLASGIDTFVEVAPHPVLSASIAQLCERRSAATTIVGSMRRRRPENQTMKMALGALYSAGVNVRWDAIFKEGGSRVALPLYPWQRTRHWLRSAPAPRRKDQGHPLLGRRIVSQVLKGPLFEITDIDGFP